MLSERSFVGVGDGQFSFGRVDHRSPSAVRRCSVADQLSSPLPCSLTPTLLLGTLRLRRCPLLMGSVEGEALVDRLELFWPCSGLQRSTDDLIHSGLVQLILPLETTDRPLQDLIRLSPLIPVGQLVDDPLLFGKAALDWIGIWIIVLVLVVIGRRSRLGRWRLSERDSILLTEESERRGRLGLQCSLKGECVLSLLALSSQLLCLAGVVGVAAIPLQRFTERNLGLLAVDLDADVAIREVINGEVFLGYFLEVCLIGGLSVSGGYPVFGTTLRRTRFPFI